MLPQLKDPGAERKQPTITTWGKGNHSIRTEHWRYIKHSNGEEELYDHRVDPNEWNNLAGDPKYAEIIAEHRRFLPEENRKPAPGSRARILIYENGKVNWEGTDIAEDDPVPEI